MPSFHHAHHRFHLASFGVFRIVERFFHLPSVWAAGQSDSGPADLRRNMACDSHDLAGEFVIRLRIVSGVSNDMVDSCKLCGFPDKPSEFVHVGPRTIPGRMGQNHVIAAIAYDAELGELTRGRILYRAGSLRLASHEIAAGMMRVEAGGIDSGRFDLPIRTPRTAASTLLGSHGAFQQVGGTR